MRPDFPDTIEDQVALARYARAKRLTDTAKLHALMPAWVKREMRQGFEHDYPHVLSRPNSIKARTVPIGNGRCRHTTFPSGAADTAAYVRECERLWNLKAA